MYHSTKAKTPHSGLFANVCCLEPTFTFYMYKIKVVILMKMCTTCLYIVEDIFEHCHFLFLFLLPIYIKQPKYFSSNIAKTSAY